MSLILAGLCLQNIKGQDLPVNNFSHKIEYQDIREYSNFPKSELYYLAKEWLLINDFIVLMEDSTSTRILAEKMFKSHYPGENGFFSLEMSRERGIRYNLILEFKDYKVRYTFTNFKILKFKDPLTYSIQSNYGTYLIKEDEGEIEVSDAENYFPVEKINQTERKAYTYFLKELDSNVNALISSLNEYLGQNSQW